MDKQQLVVSVWTCSRNRDAGGVGGPELKMSCTQDQKGLGV